AAGKLLVVVVGEFKQGKSSLINALLNEPDLFPVDFDITTNLVSTFSYGNTERITVLLGEGAQTTSQPISRTEIPNYVSEQGNAGNVRNAQLLSMESPNPQLRDGLTLVDTPGVGGIYAQHIAITYAFIPNADAVLFVSDVEEAVSQPELDFLQ